MIFFIIFLLAVLVACFAILKIGDAFSPWMLTSAVWLGIFIMFSLFGYNLYPLENRLYTCVMIWVPILVLTSVATYYALPVPEGANVNADIELTNKPYKLLFAIAVVCSPLYLYQVVKIAMMFDVNNLLNNIRIFSSYGEKDTLLSLLKYISPINQALFIVEIWRYPKVAKWRLATIVFSNLFCTIAIMAKMPIFILALTTLYILYEKKQLKIKNIFIWATILLVLFYWINILRKPVGENSESSFLDFFSIYVLSPSVAFEWSQEKLVDQFGTFSLAFFYALISKLGLGIYYVQSQLQDFVHVPIPTNVYTVFQPYFEDFGYKGVAMFASVWGVMTGWIYRLVRNGNAMAKCMYAYFVLALFMQFYQESLFVNLSIVIQFFVFFSLLIKHNVSFKIDWSRKGKS